MTEPTKSDPVRLPLTLAAQKLSAAAAYKAPRGAAPRALQWMLAIAETTPELLKAGFPGADAGHLRRLVRSALTRGDGGPELTQDEVVIRASSLAAAEGRSEADESDVVRAVLDASAGVLEALAGGAPEPEPPAPARAADAPGPDRPPAPAPSGGPRRRTSRSFLERFTVDLTDAARQGKLAPVVGREVEMDLIIETLCRVTKRNPALVGPAGVGKTAIVEGLAQRLTAGNCPRMLRDTTVFVLQPASLLAGASTGPEYAERVQRLIKEASDPSVILFVDEVHSLLERGTATEQDLVTLLKPALARGDLACIAATTDDEYRRIFETDTALERRFQPIRIGEMGREATLVVLEAHRDRLAEQRDVRVTDSVLRRIVDLAGDRMPNRRFPDKAVDVLEQAVAHAVYAGQTAVGTRDVGTVIERLTGTPADMAERLETLREDLVSGSLLVADDAETLVRHLRVSTAGLDIRPERPNAVVMMQGQAARLADDLSAAIARRMAGSVERVVAVDFGAMLHPADITRLIGASPSYIGYGDRLPIHELIQYPWSVLLCQDVDLCHPSIAAALAHALRRGVIVDGLGRSIRLCDSVVVLTVNRDRSSAEEAPIGLRERRAPEKADVPAARRLSPELADVCTLVVSRAPEARSNDAVQWLHQDVLPALAKRYRLRGLEVEWGQGVAEWAVSCTANPDRRDLLENELAARVGDHLLGYLPASGKARVRVEVSDEDLAVVPITGRRRRAAKP